MIVELVMFGTTIYCLYNLYKDINNQEEIYRVEHKEFIDDDTYFKLKDEEQFLKDNQR